MNDKMQGFAGFPAGKMPTTPIPNQFFSELLPMLDDLAELKVTLHVFWLIGRKRGNLRYARLSELLSDRLLLSGLPDRAMPVEDALVESLERAVARGTLLHTTLQRGGQSEEWYMVNSANGREVLDKLRSGELDLLGDIAEDVQLEVERPLIFTLYEQNIGMLTPMITDELRDAERRFPADWIADAFRESVKANKRSWRYVLRILERWRTEGRGAIHDKGVIPTEGDALLRHYVPEGYEDLIEH